MLQAHGGEPNEPAATVNQWIPRSGAADAKGRAIAERFNRM